jgi:CDP-glycerol glycerophosphotransferase (TagB/SpsB family)
MLLDRPIVYYTPDLKEFLSSSRALNFHPKEIAVGPMCEAFPELLTAIENIIQSGAADYDGKRKEVFPRLHGFRDGRASERVLEIISERYFEGALVSQKEPEIPLV